MADCPWPDTCNGYQEAFGEKKKKKKHLVDGWMDEWMGGQVNGWVERWVGKCIMGGLPCDLGSFVQKNILEHKELR